MIFFLEYTECG